MQEAQSFQQTTHADHDTFVVVPGIFFDLNPAKRRDLFDSPCHHFVRLSYGPKMETLEKGLDGIERVVNK